MKSIAVPMILVLAAYVAAQIPASSPSSVPANQLGSQAAPPASLPVTLPTNQSDAQPATQASATSPAFAATDPTSGPTSTGPSGFATTESSYRSFNSFSSGSYSGRRDYFRPDSSATTLPSDNPLFKPKPYPRQYSAMLTRSIFIKGRQQVFDSGSRRDHVDPPRTTNPSGPPLSSSISESMLVFNGASDADGQLIAFLENTGMNQIARYHVGDPVGQGAPGKITAITLDSIDYSSGSRVTHVRLGQNLNGIDVPIITTQPVAETFGSSSGPPGTSQPSSGTTSSGTAVSDIERRMREKRLKELGQ